MSSNEQAATAPVTVSLHGATFSYGGPPSLIDVDATFHAGDAVALVGPNGSGKSTLLKGLLGLVTAVAGSVEVLGTTPRRARPQVGYLPQTDELDPWFPISLRQVVMMGRYRAIGWGRWPSRADRDAVARALDRVGLADHAGQRFGALSGGQQQRGILARALTSDPKILLLDEPFNGLDSTNRDSLISVLESLRTAGVTVITSTHDLQLARDVCNQVMLLNRHVVAAGPLDQTLTVENIAATFEGVGVHVDQHVLATPPHEHGHAQ